MYREGLTLSYIRGIFQYEWDDNTNKSDRIFSRSHPVYKGWDTHYGVLLQTNQFNSGKLNNIYLKDNTMKKTKKTTQTEKTEETT